MSWLGSFSLGFISAPEINVLDHCHALAGLRAFSGDSHSKIHEACVYVSEKRSITFIRFSQDVLSL